MSLPNYKTCVFSGPTKSIVGATAGSTDYLDIKWIGSTGTQYINTGVTPTTSYNIEVVGIKDCNASLFGSGSCSYVLTGNGSGTDKYPNYFYVGQTQTSPAEAGLVVGTIDQTVKHTWSIINGQGYCDGVAATPTRIGSTQPTNSLFLFARNTGSFNDGGTHVIYSVKIWDGNGNLIRNYTPKILLSTGKPGLYDTVNNVFYANNGTNEFTYELESYKANVSNSTSYKTLILKAYPVKGQLITMSLGNSTPISGTQDLYRVLSINGSVAEVVAMYNPALSVFTSLFFCLYEGGELDTYLNDTFYSSLSATAKSAIVDKYITINRWLDNGTGDPVYTGYYGTTNPGTTAYTISCASGGTSYATRHIYALDTSDVINYVKDTTLGDGELQNYNIWKMLLNSTNPPGTQDFIWLRSPGLYGECACEIDYQTGKVKADGHYIGTSLLVRPAFCIDLSKIIWN